MLSRRIVEKEWGKRYKFEQDRMKPFEPAKGADLSYGMALMMTIRRSMGDEISADSRSDKLAIRKCPLRMSILHTPELTNDPP